MGRGSEVEMQAEIDKMRREGGTGEGKLGGEEKEKNEELEHI